MFGPNVIEPRGLVPVTRLSPYLVALFQVAVTNRSAVYVASVHLGEAACLQTMLVRRPKARSHVGGLRLVWKTLLKVDAEETGYGGVYWVHLNGNGHYWPAVVYTVMNLLVLSYSLGSIFYQCIYVCIPV